jgi:hypothetical protein
MKRPFSLLVTAGWHVRRKSLLPSVKKLSQEIKGMLGSMATGLFTTRSDMEGEITLQESTMPRTGNARPVTRALDPEDPEPSY